MEKLQYVDMSYYILRKDGAYAGVCMWSGSPSIRGTSPCTTATASAMRTQWRCTRDSRSAGRQCRGGDIWRRSKK